MKLGCSIPPSFDSQQSWLDFYLKLGCKAVYFPVDYTAPKAEIEAYAQAARENGLAIAEVGAWSNPISKDDQTRRTSLERCKGQLALADEIGARCCVNIVGSLGEDWAAPSAEHYEPHFFAMVVDMVREIVDAVKPKRTFYTLETMQWVLPDSPESYLDIIKAVDRPGFAAHFDPVNMSCTLDRYYNSGAFLERCFDILGPYIKSCHAKDLTLRNIHLIHFDEVLPGTGGIDFGAYLRGLAKLDPDTTLIVEHLQTDEQYAAAIAHIRGVAKENGIAV